MRPTGNRPTSDNRGYSKYLQDIYISILGKLNTYETDVNNSLQSYESDRLSNLNTAQASRQVLSNKIDTVENDLKQTVDNINLENTTALTSLETEILNTLQIEKNRIEDLENFRQNNSDELAQEWDKEINTKVYSLTVDSIKQQLEASDSNLSLSIANEITNRQNQDNENTTKLQRYENLINKWLQTYELWDGSKLNSFDDVILQVVNQLNEYKLPSSTVIFQHFDNMDNVNSIEYLGKATNVRYETTHDRNEVLSLVNTSDNDTVIRVEQMDLTLRPSLATHLYLFDNVELETPNGISFTGWFSFNQENIVVPDKYHILFSANIAPSSNLQAQRYHLIAIQHKDNGNGGYDIVNTYRGSGLRQSNYVRTLEIPDIKDVHLTFTIEFPTSRTNNGKYNIYINGEIFSSVDIHYENPTYVSYDVMNIYSVGTYITGTEGSSPFLYDDTGIYSKMLDADTIRNIYNASKDPNTSFVYEPA